MDGAFETIGMATLDSDLMSGEGKGATDDSISASSSLIS